MHGIICRNNVCNFLHVRSRVGTHYPPCDNGRTTIARRNKSTRITVARTVQENLSSSIWCTYYIKHTSCTCMAKTQILRPYRKSNFRPCESVEKWLIRTRIAAYEFNRGATGCIIKYYCPRATTRTRRKRFVLLTWPFRLGPSWSADYFRRPRGRRRRGRTHNNYYALIDKYWRLSIRDSERGSTELYWFYDDVFFCCFVFCFISVRLIGDRCATSAGKSVLICYA